MLFTEGVVITSYLTLKYTRCILEAQTDIARDLLGYKEVCREKKEGCFMVMVEDAKGDIHELYNLLSKRGEQPAELLDITDVLLQVYQKLDKEKNPATLLNRLVNYIRNAALKGRLHFSKKEEGLIIQLGVFGQKAGLNGIYQGDYSDKSQFYSYLEQSQMPRR